MNLKPHQAEIVPWLLERRNAMLAWEMGVGKTAPLLQAWERSRELGPALVLCPNTARENWRREVQRFALDPENPPKAIIATHTRTAPFVRNGADIVICNYEKVLQQNYSNAFGGDRWGVIILDEAHRLKNPDAKTTKVTYIKRWGSPPLIKSSKRVWTATGTPMPNHPGELYTHCAALWPEHIQYNGHAMAQWEFEAQYCEMRPTQYGMQVVGGRNLKELRERLIPVVSILKRKDVLNLPPLTVDTWPLDGTRASGSRHKDVPGLLGTLEERYGTIPDIERFDAGTLEAYLACINSALQPLPSLRRETAQLKAVYTALTLHEELEFNTTKAVVFAIHREAIATMEKALSSFKPAVVHGDIPDKQRQAEIDRFQTDPNCRVFIGQLNVAGTAINLQAATKVIFVELSWTPGDNEQALSRVYRMGQTCPVQVRIMYLPDSVDEAVSKALRRKMAMISEVFQ
jgi:SWI/SNF-related matrix-associated actin-dependent regulator of chromatin subfamily A-like protein 1